MDNGFPSISGVYLGSVFLYLHITVAFRLLSWGKKKSERKIDIYTCSSRTRQRARSILDIKALRATGPSTAMLLFPLTHQRLGSSPGARGADTATRASKIARRAMSKFVL